MLHSGLWVLFQGLEQPRFLKEITTHIVLKTVAVVTSFITLYDQATLSRKLGFSKGHDRISIVHLWR
jgi:hypothetical protein